MGRPDFEIINNKNSKQCMNFNTGCVTNVTF